MAENSERKQRGRGRPFRKGESGNPAGKPPGARNRTTLAIQELLDGEAENLTRKCVELALAGDTVALRLCLERLAPPLRERHMELSLPSVATAADLPAAIGAVLKAVAAGEITPGEAQAVVGLLDAQRRAVETTDLGTRVERLESEVNERRCG